VLAHDGSIFMVVRNLKNLLGIARAAFFTAASAPLPVTNPNADNSRGPTPYFWRLGLDEFLVLRLATSD